MKQGVHRASRICVIFSSFLFLGAGTCGEFVLVEVDPLPGESENAGITINDSGQIVGYSGMFGFKWSPSGDLINIGTLGGASSVAWNINASGNVVGSSETESGEEHAFMFTDSGGMQDLGTLGGSISIAESITDSNEIVGGSMNDNSEFRAFLWTPRTETMIDLGTLGGVEAYAVDRNEAGQIVGLADTKKGATHAFLYTQETGMLDLGTLGGKHSEAWGIRHDGVVLGISETSKGQTSGFLWIPDQPNGVTGTMINLGTWKGIEVIPQSISSNGTVVGSTVDEKTALIFTSRTGWANLNTLVDGVGDFVLQVACDVDTVTSKITGWGVRGGLRRAFILENVNVCLFSDGFESGDTSAWSTVVGFRKDQ